ncbi:MAG: hypothetical protein HWN67_09090 [Candidatus Helarchaeota archaeon]|nr:hypothetical protein [Candidatus Helarchaeota archaeon]
MSWKEIKRIEQIIRKERGDKAIFIRLIKEDENVSSIIFGIEDKNSKNSIKLSIGEWNNLLSFFNTIDEEIKSPQISVIEEEKDIISNELETQTPTEVIIQEPSEVIPEAKVIGSAFEEPTSTVTLIHKDMTSKTEETVLPSPVDIEEIEPPSEVIAEPIELEKPPSEVIAEPIELEKPPSPPAVVVEETEPQIEAKPKPTELEKPPSPPAIVLEHIEPPSEVKSKKPVPEPTIPSPVLIPEVSKISTEKEDLFPEMPPEVKEIFEELDSQAIELEKSLIVTEDESSDSELTKEVKITKAMQEVAELMPSGPAKDFVEQMIVKRKETKDTPEEISDSSKEKEASDIKEEIKNDIKEEEKLKYW